VNWLWAYLALLGLVAGERGAELSVSTRNARRLLARGGRESGQRLYQAMVAFHALFLPALALGAIAYREPPSPWAWLAVAGALAAQGLRWWAVRTLGGRWSTRVIVVPGDPPVTGGPYRYLRHPNYLAVIVEMACLPLAWGMWRLALVFTVGNAIILWFRIRDEERALGPAWDAAFAGKGRFVP
jgi:methyltransferase